MRFVYCNHPSTTWINININTIWQINKEKKLNQSLFQLVNYAILVSHLHDWALPIHLTNIKLRLAGLLAENVALSKTTHFTVFGFQVLRCLSLQNMYHPTVFSYTSFYMECQFKMDCFWNIITHTHTHTYAQTYTQSEIQIQKEMSCQISAFCMMYEWQCMSPKPDCLIVCTVTERVNCLN